MEVMPLLMGQAAGAIDDVKPAKDIMIEMVEGAIDIIKASNSLVVKASEASVSRAKL
jgi:NAD(P)H-dependent flavin oxidoreductase YrpB (nitropropane dioxygenase family)